MWVRFLGGNGIIVGRQVGRYYSIAPTGRCLVSPLWGDSSFFSSLFSIPPLRGDVSFVLLCNPPWKWEMRNVISCGGQRKLRVKSISAEKNSRVQSLRERLSTIAALPYSRVLSQTQTHPPLDNIGERWRLMPLRAAAPEVRA